MKFLIKIVPKFFRDRYRPLWHNIQPEINSITVEIQSVFAKLKRQFLRPPFPKLKNEQINLHLGCGSINHSSFINIDGLPAPHIHYVRAIDNLSPFRDDSVDLIYACHCLEHFPYHKVPRVLAEWFRVLKHNGVLRLSVPNFDLLLDIYKDNGNNVNTILGPLMGGQDYKFNFHMTVFNRSSLESLLKDTGFKLVQEWQPDSCELTTFDDFSTYKSIIHEKHYRVSLNIEALK